VIIPETGGCNFAGLLFGGRLGIVVVVGCFFIAAAAGAATFPSGAGTGSFGMTVVGADGCSMGSIRCRRTGSMLGVVATGGCFP